MKQESKNSSHFSNANKRAMGGYLPQKLKNILTLAESGHSSGQEFEFSQGYATGGYQVIGYLVLFSLILGLFLALAGQTLADKDLVLYYPFDQQGGQKAIDKSLRGNNGAIENGKWVAGKFGNALESNK